MNEAKPESFDIHEREHKIEYEKDIYCVIFKSSKDRSLIESIEKKSGNRSGNRFLKPAGHFSQVMILSNIKNSCGVCVLCVTSSPTVKLSARNYDGKHSERNGI